MGDLTIAVPRWMWDEPTPQKDPVPMSVSVGNGLVVMFSAEDASGIATLLQTALGVAWPVDAIHLEPGDVS